MRDRTYFWKRKWVDGEVCLYKGVGEMVYYFESGRWLLCDFYVHDVTRWINNDKESPWIRITEAEAALLL